MIEINNLSKSFGERSVLKNLNLKIDSGEIVFVLGMSGTGKSVLLKLLVGLLKYESGSIQVAKQDITNFLEDDFLEIRKTCGMVFQHPALFDSLSVFENVAYGLRKSTQFSEEKIRSRVQNCLQAVNLGNIENARPLDLSYGMQKRVSLARTLAMNPQILLFDEPTTGLDPISTTAINELIQKLSRDFKTTSVVVSHDMQCALSIADRIVVLHEGSIVAQGAPDELKRSQVPIVRQFLSEVLDDRAE